MENIIDKIKTVNDFNFKNKVALVRVDFNVPVDRSKSSHKISDDTRIQYSIPTLKKIISDYGKIVLISHFGRPKGSLNRDHNSLKIIIPLLSKQLKIPIKFSDNCIGENVKKNVKMLKNKEILLLENLRFYKEEEEGNEKFALKLANLGDIYVNEAFSVSHRSHASISVIPKFFDQKKCIGLLMKKEIQSLNKVLGKNKKKPISILLGGSKIYSKIKIIESIIHFADNILIGGGMAYPFIKEKGGNVGNSIVIEKDENEKTKRILKNIIEKCRKKNNLFFPKDVVIADSFHNHATKKIVSIYSIPNGWMGLDIASSSIKYFCDIINESNTIFWNGPLGVFEFPNFSLGTKSIAKAIANATERGAFSLVGGGDTISSLKIEKLEKKISYLSTGGGAMLESFKNQILPGIKAMISS
ncbi:phosphoglycerate kinase [Blattabacterium cuenoti]|uniref:phosphoglycerate kinase n=1 Tax=Blattabacterium cuenoti TaxID=1653831 RepID=UPI00163C3A9E|nr:phosphoglycerate kinase [Blattabacterium cuenoti]